MKFNLTEAHVHILTTLNKSKEDFINVSNSFYIEKKIKTTLKDDISIITNSLMNILSIIYDTKKVTKNNRYYINVCKLRMMRYRSNTEEYYNYYDTMIASLMDVAFEAAEDIEYYEAMAMLEYIYSNIYD